MSCQVRFPTNHFLFFLFFFLLHFSFFLSLFVLCSSIRSFFSSSSSFSPFSFSLLLMLMLLLLLLWLWWVSEFLRSGTSSFVTVGCSGGYGGGCCDDNKGTRPDPFRYNLGTSETGQPWSSGP